MNPTWVTLLTFASTTLLVAAVIGVLHDAFFRYRWSVNERLAELSGHGKGDGASALFDLKQLHAESSRVHSSWRSRLRDAVEQAGLKIHLSSLLGLSLGLGMAGALAATIVWPVVWVALFGFAPGAAAPWIYVMSKRAGRARQLTRQLPEAFDVIARSVRAGQSVPAAFQIVADDVAGPLGDEFRRCYEQQNLGVSFDHTLRNLARRTGIMELQILVVGLLVQSRAGGNVVELLRNLSMMVRNRLKMKQKVKALTGEGRMQATVLIVLPIAAFASLLVLSPDYMTSLTQRPWLLAATAAAQIVGAVWMRRIVAVAV